MSVTRLPPESRDARGVVTGLAVHTTGVRSLRFDRVKRSPFAPIN